MINTFYLIMIFSFALLIVLLLLVVKLIASLSKKNSKINKHNEAPIDESGNPIIKNDFE